ncbi:putative enoyl-CoA hydratase 1 [Mycobacteroides salmoniphilum]|uniref:Putative enoyl-CoA hydratase 1 n=1 Tax=Mycobacteroides salmoniphilum TaxID=404941 RepID=A0A4R8RVJ5_9MYCO|nr:MaoC family dehydratase [Mycobacteroides salmoniphilum]TDZ76512.1 putative enoyl-CoA hydratase 1 [Mycobacteroides salmoniphilum]TDZ78497.1 putative enoyl-CoA hydratase 1 [Mycobacteroides salmoniphilum]TDZ85030.1 putative enoyl-CoA hydratase 1 [Mycobacteroides salmoniphilum]
MSTKVFNGIDQVAVGDLGITDWLLVDQERVNTFADATGDHQWIHVDTERAADGPFGGTIAHGLLTLSLLPQFQFQLIRVDNIAMGINYGYNKIRFLNPVRVGSRLRARAEVTNVEQKPGAVDVTVLTTVEIEGADKPACVAESISRYIA